MSLHHQGTDPPTRRATTTPVAICAIGPRGLSDKAQYQLREEIGRGHRLVSSGDIQLTCTPQPDAASQTV